MNGFWLERHKSGESRDFGFEARVVGRIHVSGFEFVANLGARPHLQPLSPRTRERGVRSAGRGWAARLELNKTTQLEFSRGDL
jgi:hypothetical protein